MLLACVVLAGTVTMILVAIYSGTVDLEAMMPSEAENITSSLFGGSCNATEALYNDGIASAGSTWSEWLSAALLSSFCSALVCLSAS